MNDDETPTPRASGLWREWLSHAQMLADRLDAFAMLRRRRIELLDIRRALEAERLASDARALVAVFGRWPVVPPADEDRARTIQRLADLQREGEELITSNR